MHGVSRQDKELRCAAPLPVGLQEYSIGRAKAENIEYQNQGTLQLLPETEFYYFWLFIIYLIYQLNAKYTWYLLYQSSTFLIS